VLALLGVSVVYGLIGKPLVAITERIVGALPPTVVDQLPKRFTEDFVG
jgi:uncharacterized MnhB-related membrane protein